MDKIREFYINFDINIKIINYLKKSAIRANKIKLSMFYI